MESKRSLIPETKRETAGEVKKIIKVLVFGDDVQPEIQEQSLEGPMDEKKKYNIEMTLGQDGPVWDQVRDMLMVTKTKFSDIEFDVIGSLGFRTLKEIDKISEHGTVKWYLPQKSLKDAETKIAGLAHKGRITILAENTPGAPKATALAF